MKWQPIETAPKDGTKVLIVDDEGEMAVAGYVEQWGERTEFVRKAKDGDVYRTIREETGYWDTDTAYCPTHWIPLPEPTNAGGERTRPTTKLDKRTGVAYTEAFGENKGGSVRSTADIRLSEQEEKLAAITAAIEEYYSALDRRQHGGVAQDIAFNKIQQILSLHWQQGKTLQAQLPI